MAILFSGLQPASAKTATPDAVTVSASSEGVTLCRPRGTRCFIPEVDDPIFIGDVIETNSSGRLEFTVRAPETRIFLLPGSKIRIDRDTAQDFVEVEILRGSIGIEPAKDQTFDVTFGSMLCTVGAGQAAIEYAEPKPRTRAATITNVNAPTQCFSTPHGDYDVPPGTVVTFTNGRRSSQTPTVEGFWSKHFDKQGR